MRMWAVTVASILTLSGCVSQSADGRIVGHYLGYVRVVHPATLSNGVRLDDVRALGGWMEVDPASGRIESTGLGLRHSDRITLPLDCRLAIIVTDAAQLAAVETLIKAHAGGRPCLVKRDTDD